MWSTKEMEAAEWTMYWVSLMSALLSSGDKPSPGSPKSPFTTTSFLRTCNSGEDKPQTLQGRAQHLQLPASQPPDTVPLSRTEMTARIAEARVWAREVFDMHCTLVSCTAMRYRLLLCWSLLLRFFKSAGKHARCNL